MTAQKYIAHLSAELSKAQRRLAMYENAPEAWRWVRVSEELLQSMKDKKSAPVRVWIEGEDGKVLTLVFELA